MKKIIAIGGSNSKQSINKTFATYVAKQIAQSKTVVIDLNDFELPLYGIDLENEKGIPYNAKKLVDLIETADGLVISLAEHNGCYSTAFKNVYDWMSRVDKKVWKDKPMLLMATSPGARGAATVLQIAKAGFPFLGGNIIATFSLPSFKMNFSEDGIKDEALNNDLIEKIRLFESKI